jgi:hypothetical protein
MAVGGLLPRFAGACVEYVVEVGILGAIFGLSCFFFPRSNAHAQVVFVYCVVIAFLGLMPVVQISCNKFYAEILDTYQFDAAPRQVFRIANVLTFIPTLASDIGLARKRAGYVYALSQTVFAFSTGLLFPALFSLWK